MVHTSSLLFPKARLGYRVRRVRWLIAREKHLESLANKLRPGQARGVIDVSTYVTNDQLRHIQRLGYVYAEAAITVTGWLAATAYLAAAGVLFARADLSYRTWLLLLLAVAAFIIASGARHMAAAEIDRVESIQHTFAIRQSDHDLETMKSALTRLKSDFEIAPQQEAG